MPEIATEETVLISEETNGDVSWYMFTGSSNYHPTLTCAPTRDVNELVATKLTRYQRMFITREPYVYGSTLAFRRELCSALIRCFREKSHFNKNLTRDLIIETTQVVVGPASSM